MENVNPHEELKRLDEQIKSATELAALKPIFYRLNTLIQTFPADFDVQFTGNEIKQRLIERGMLLKQQETSPPGAPDSVPPPQPGVQPPLPPSFLDASAPAAGSPPESAGPPAGAPSQLSSPIFDSSPPPPPPPTLAVPENPADATTRPPTLPTAPPRPALNWKRTAVIGPVAGLLVAVVLVLLVVHQARRPAANNAAHNLAAAVQVNITTTPPGASVRVAAKQPAASGNKETTCTSDCRVMLAPGVYQVSAFLEGFESAQGAVTVAAGQPPVVRLTLQPQAQSIRLLTDLARGRVVLDDQPAVDLQEGQLVLDKVARGTHTVKVTGQNADASFSFEMADARLPAVASSVKARNMIAVLVASFGKQARVVTNAGPWKLTVNGQQQGDAGPAGTDLTSFQTGVNEIVVGEGRDERNMSESFGAAPMLTAFLKTDVNAGTLIVSTGQDDVRLFLNGKEYGRRTQRGQLRIQTLGKVAVRVAKSGFQDEPAQTVEVKKGAEVRLQFELKPQPQFASLQIQGAMAATEVLIDQKEVGSVGTDGSFSIGAIQPGDHTLELRHEQFLPKRLQRAFRAGQAVVLAGADAVLSAANGTIRLTRSPASATITYRRGDETESHDVHRDVIELPAGSYALSARAPGYTESTMRVQLAPGENREVQFTLVRERPAAPPPVVASGMAEFEDAESWKKEGDSWVHTGGGFVPYKLPPRGIFTFTAGLLKGGGVLRAGQIRWCVQYIDAKNYLLYEIDRKNFWAGVIENGKRYERVKAAHNLGNQKSFTIQVEVTADRAVQRVRVGQDWKVLDTFTEPGRDFTAGKFGFLIQGNDEIAISGFTFLPR
ncbi:MAG TPA: PEGA domain-containing protein [Bryobacteraceae bacterium]|nr:PEGA domain-containing protein [Bryobacteraceae bacterium]